MCEKSAPVISVLLVQIGRSLGAAQQSEGHVAGTAAEIEDFRARLFQDRVEVRAAAPPPQTIDVER